jgi:tRNA(Ile)-lysidine synthase
LRADLPLLDQLRRTDQERGLLRPESRVLVAVSGGPDSLALLHALCALREELSIHLVAAHLNHRMRPAECEADAQFILATGAGWGIPVDIGARDVTAFARRTGLSLEEAGREARYRFFGRAARRHRCDTIATAHTADDQAETVLLHLLRGTGLDGLAGIPACRPLRSGRPTPVVVRPLLAVTRRVVMAYCHSHGLQPRTDITNESPEFLRNRVRRELMPLLEAGYSPAVRRHLLRLARLAEEETALLNEQARELLRAAREDHGGSTLERVEGRSSDHLSRAVLKSAPQALARRALRLSLHELLPGPPPEWSTVDRLLGLLDGKTPGFPLPGGRHVARATHQALILEPQRQEAPFLEAASTPLAIPGVTHLPWGAGRIITRLVGTGEDTMPSSPAELLPLPPGQALLDRDRVVGALTVRPPCPGDRIQPLGMRGSRKLQDLLTDRKLPAAARRRLPVVCDEEKLVWVAGDRTSEAVKVTPDTRSAVWLEWVADADTSGDEAIGGCVR